MLFWHATITHAVFSLMTGLIMDMLCRCHGYIEPFEVVIGIWGNILVFKNY